MKPSKLVSKTGVKFVLSLTATSVLVAVPILLPNAERLLAQSAPTATPFALPSTLPDGSQVRVNGTPSLAALVESLKQRYETRYPGSKFDLTSIDVNAALQAVLQGSADVVAVGRPLTDQEKQQGLNSIPLTTEKIAIIVGSDNPFKGSLTSEQFAQIFRGEITNWSQVGGPDAPIRFVDRPESSDTRQALSRYPVFQQAPFQTGSTAAQLSQDDTAAVVKELGKDGISYAILNQAESQAGVQILPMHDTLPTDPRYPFSQPRVLVFKSNPGPQAIALLGLATTPVGQEGVAAASNATAATASPEGTTAPTASPEAAAPSPAAAATPTTETNGFPWWWLLLPLLALGALWALMRGRGGAVPPVAAANTYDSRIILTPRNCRDAYAYWEVPEEHKADLRREGGRNLKVRLHDVTDIPDMDRQKPHQTWQFNCDEQAQDLHIPITRDDRDYIAELGYVGEGDRWFSIARSKHVRVPRCTPADFVAPSNQSASFDAPQRVPAAPVASVSGNGVALPDMAVKAAGAAVVGGAAAAAARAITVTKTGEDAWVPQTAPVSNPAVPYEMPQDCRIILVPRNDKDAYAYWEVAEKYRQPLREQGGKRLMLRIHDATNIDIDREVPHSTQTYVVSETDQDKHVEVPMRDRDYIADLGYLADDGRWLRLIRSFHVHVPQIA